MLIDRPVVIESDCANVVSQVSYNDFIDPPLVAWLEKSRVCWANFLILLLLRFLEIAIGLPMLSLVKAGVV